MLLLFHFQLIQILMSVSADLAETEVPVMTVSMDTLAGVQKDGVVLTVKQVSVLNKHFF